MGERLNQWLSRERQSPTIEVEIDRDSIWENPLFKGRIPFNLEKVLSRFLVNKTPDGVKSLHFGIDYIHGREGLIGKIDLSDSLGTKYCEVRLKGNAYVIPPWMPYPWPGSRLGKIQRRDDGISYPDESMGIVGKKVAEREAADLIALATGENPVRVPQVLAYAPLLTFAQPNGEILTIPEARRQGVISKNPDFSPVVEIRAFRNGERVEHEGLIDPKLEPAMGDIAEELQRDIFGAAEYLNWMIVGAAVDLARCYHQNKFHGSLNNGHNLTLAREIMDFSEISAETLKKGVAVLVENDVQGMIKTLVMLRNRVFMQYAMSRQNRERFSDNNVEKVFRAEYQKEVVRLDKDKSLELQSKPLN